MNGTFTDDRDGQIYKTVKIGNQIWLAENFAFNTNPGAWAYNDDLKNIANFGLLYSWESAIKIVPNGWHLPTKQDFEKLINRYGNEYGAYMKLIQGGESGFNNVFAGYRNHENEYISKDTYTSFWSVTDIKRTHAWYFNIDSDFEMATISNFVKSIGFSVRLIKD